MKEIQELKAMLPEDVGGVIGCTVFKGHVDDAWREMERAHRMASAKLERDGISEDDKRRVLAEEANAEAAFTRAVQVLNAERRELMCEPPGLAPNPSDVLKLTYVAGFHGERGLKWTPAVTALQAKIKAFNDRTRPELKEASDRYDRARHAWILSINPPENKPSPATIRARNMAGTALVEACRPFLAEARKLQAQRAAVLKAAKTTTVQKARKS